MKAFWKLEKPQVVAEAAEAQKGLHIALELLIFVGVFLVSFIGESCLMAAGLVVMLLFEPEFWQLFTSGEFKTLDAFMSQYNYVINKVTNSENGMIVSLFVTIAMTVLVMLFCKFLQKRKMSSLGFHKKGLVKEYLIGWGVGFVLFSAAVLLCVLTGSLTLEGISPTFSIGTFLVYVVGFIIQGMSEEVLCRGYFQVSVGRRYSVWTAIIANSVFFAALHLPNRGISPLALVNLTLFGVFASVYFVKRNDIWGICAVHSVWNLVQGNVYNIRVSGMELSCSLFSSEVVEGKELIHGGAFGLEGGLAVTLVLVVGTIIMLCTKGRKEEVAEA